MSTEITPKNKLATERTYLYGSARKIEQLLFKKSLQADLVLCHHVSGARPTAGLGIARVITSDPPHGKVPPPPPSSTMVQSDCERLPFFSSSFSPNSCSWLQKPQDIIALLLYYYYYTERTTVKLWEFFLHKLFITQWAPLKKRKWFKMFRWEFFPLVLSFS